MKQKLQLQHHTAPALQISSSARLRHRAGSLARAAASPGLLRAPTLQRDKEPLLATDSLAAIY